MKDYLSQIVASLGILALSGAAFASYCYWAIDRLPDTMAVHYGPGGTPDRFSSPTEFGTGMMICGGVVFLLFALISIFLPRLPEGFINLPNRDYWLAPDRRGQSLASFSNLFLLYGAVTLLFLLFVSRAVVNANLVDIHQPISITWPLILFGSASVAFLFLIVSRFSGNDGNA